MGERALTIPFLKWAGGKRQLLDSLLPLARAGLSEGGTYYEPFLGGGALFFALRPKKAVLSDINAELVHAYVQVRDNVEALISMLSDYQARLDREGLDDLYYEVRSKYNDVKQCLPSDFEGAERLYQAARFIFLNRTGFNGLYRENKKGEFNVPKGRYKRPKCLHADLLRSASAALQGAEIQVAGYRHVEARARRGDLVYFDPPYIPVSETADFVSFTKEGFSDEMQVDLALLCARLAGNGVGVMASNADAPRARLLYQSLCRYRVEAKRNINSKSSKRGSVGELLAIGGFHAPETALEVIEGDGVVFSARVNMGPLGGYDVSPDVWASMLEDYKKRIEGGRAYGTYGVDVGSSDLDLRFVSHKVTAMEGDFEVGELRLSCQVLPTEKGFELMELLSRQHEGLVSMSTVAYGTVCGEGENVDDAVILQFVPKGGADDV